MAALNDHRVTEVRKRIDRHVNDTLDVEDDSDGKASLFDGDLWVILHND
jgi:hypothetical protein